MRFSDKNANNIYLCISHTFVINSQINRADVTQLNVKTCFNSQLILY